MNYQTPDFSFIERAGNIAGQAIKDYSAAKKIEIDNKDKQKAYQAVYKASVDRYMKETGEADPVKAGAFVAKFYLPPSREESGTQMSTRLLTVETMFEKALNDRKAQLYTERVKQGESKPIERQEPQGQVSAGEPGMQGRQQSTVEAGRVQQPGQRPQYYTTGGLERSQDSTMQEPPAPGTRTPGMTASERYGIAQDLGVTEAPGVKTDLQRSEDIETGQRFAPGQTRAQYLAGSAAEGMDVSRGAAKAVGESLPTEKDIMTNDRLLSAQKAKNVFQDANLKLRNRLANIKARQVTGDERLDIMKAKADNMTKLKRMEIQIKGIEAGLAKANKGMAFERIDQDLLQKNLDELQELNESLLVGWENDKLYDNLLKEKGGIPKDIPGKAVPGSFPQTKNDPLGIR